MNAILIILAIALTYSTPLIFGALGGVVSEKSGVVNIGIEGMMTIGAFVAASVGYFSGNAWIGFLAGGISGALFGLIHAVASVTFRADQTVSGIAINMIGGGLALFISKIIFNGAVNTPPVQNKLPRIMGIEATTILAVLLTVLIWIYIYKTSFGLRLLSVGEHPAAADTLGINVYKVRYFAIIASGFLSGLGGAAVTLSLVSSFTPTVIAGQGFIALAAVIFGKWTPHGAIGASFIFGLSQALSIYIGGDSFLPSQIVAMFPYVLTVIILVLFVGKSEAPRADGVPYEKGLR